MDSITSLLQSEYFLATGYFDRLLFALTELSEFQYTPSGREMFAKIYDRYENFFVIKFGLINDSQNESTKNNAAQFKIATFRQNIKAYHQFAEKYVSLPLLADKKTQFTIEFINLTYSLSHEMHNYVLRFTQFEIQYPNMGIIKEHSEELNSNEADLFLSKSFFIDPADIVELQNEFEAGSKINYLDLKREEKYNYFVHQGHLNINQKNYEKAQQFFYKAKNYLETAEVFTLLAWTYSFLNNNEVAKNYCLKAIQKDHQYGPAYNDFGNYLLSEGKTEESLKWFERAKRAQNYQNREYPFINAGRSYMLQNRFEDALKEFSYALVLAPYHEELHNTVHKLKINLERSHSKNHIEVENHETI